MSSTALVTAWIGQVKAGDRAAAQRLWERYCTRLVRLARAKLPASRRRVDDEEDVALSAMDSFLRAAERPPSKPARPRQLVSAAGHHYGAQGLESRTAREAHSRSRRIGPGRAQRRLLRPARLGTGSRPRAHAGNRMSSGRTLLDRLSPELRSVALWKMEGLTNDEVAKRLGCVVGTVERKLRVIRTIWQKEIAP